MDDKIRNGIGAAIGQIPSGLFILTSRHEDKRTGMLASWAQQVSFEPPMVSVAVAKGRPVMAMISASRQFGLCQIPKGDKRIMRKFASGIDPAEDPFLGFDLVENTETHVPILAQVLSYLECHLVSHIDVEADHNLIIGNVVGGNFVGGDPEIRTRKDGFKY